MDRHNPAKGRVKDRKVPPMPRIGPKIKHTRLLKGLTLRSLANAAGCSESLLSKIENGRANPSLKMIHKVASALSTPVAGLFQHGADADSVVLRRGERPVVETDQIRRGEGVQLEAVIASASGNLLSGYINHIEPGGGSDGLINTKARSSAMCSRARLSSMSPASIIGLAKATAFIFGRSRRTPIVTSAKRKRAFFGSIRRPHSDMTALRKDSFPDPGISFK